MAFGLGVLLFAFGILISIALHEAGHMFTARAFGMRVRRYFIGFGPTLWSTAPRDKGRGVATAGTTDVDVDGANLPANPAPLTAETEVATDPSGAVPQTEYGIKAILCSAKVADASSSSANKGVGFLVSDAAIAIAGRGLEQPVDGMYAEFGHQTDEASGLAVTAFVHCAPGKMNRYMNVAALLGAKLTREIIEGSNTNKAPGFIQLVTA